MLLFILIVGLFSKLFCHSKKQLIKAAKAFSANLVRDINLIGNQLFIIIKCKFDKND